MLDVIVALLVIIGIPAALLFALWILEEHGGE